MRLKSAYIGLMLFFSFVFVLDFIPIQAQETEGAINFDELLSSIKNDLELIKNQHQNSNVNENLNLYLALFTGVVIPIGILIYQPIRSKRKLVNQNMESLIKEIESNEGALTGKQGYDIIEYTGLDTEKSKIKYTNSFLDFDSYENLINSGQFSYFAPNTQNSLRELYTRIKDHYRTMKYIDELEDKFKLQFPDDDEKFLQSVVKYEIVLTKWESEILILIPETITNLKSEKKYVL